MTKRRDFVIRCLRQNLKFQIKDLAQIERSRGFLDAARLTENWLAFMKRKAMILKAHHTTHIEGTHLSLDQSKKLLEGKKVSKLNLELF